MGTYDFVDHATVLKCKTEVTNIVVKYGRIMHWKRKRINRLISSYNQSMIEMLRYPIANGIDPIKYIRGIAVILQKEQRPRVKISSDKDWTTAEVVHTVFCALKKAENERAR